MASKLPDDIFPESGFRLPLPRIEDQDEYGRKVFDRVVGPVSNSIKGLRGPSGIWLHSPRTAELQKALNEYVRFESGLSPATCELAILVAAREMNSSFEWAAHEERALKDGVPLTVVDTVKRRRECSTLPDIERSVICLGREMFSGKKVSQTTFQAALKAFGPKRLVELVTLMTLYASIAFQLRAFDMQVDGDAPLLPEL